MTTEKLTAAREAEIRKWFSPGDRAVQSITEVMAGQLLAELDRLRALQATQAPGPVQVTLDEAGRAFDAYQSDDSARGPSGWQRHINAVLAKRSGEHTATAKARDCGEGE